MSDPQDTRSPALRDDAYWNAMEQSATGPDLDKLREALEMVDKATGPDREIDYAITALFEPERHGKAREWSASLDTVTALIEREMPGSERPLLEEALAEMEFGRGRQISFVQRLVLEWLAAFLRARIAEAEAEQQEDVAALTSPRQMADN